MALDEEWRRLEDRLRGALAVDTHGVDVLSPREGPKRRPRSALIVLLQVVKSSASRDSGGHATARMSSALEGVVELYAMSERVRTSVIRTQQLWTRALTSRMMVTPLSVDDPRVWVFCRDLATDPLQIIIDFSGMALTKDACGLLEYVFAVTRQMWMRQLTLGLRFTRCRLTPENIGWLDSVLRNRSDSATSLVSNTLGLLDLSDNGLSPDALYTLAAMIRRVCVQDLRLKNALWRSFLPESIAAMASVFDAVFSPEDDRFLNCPVRLSVARTSLHAQYLEALADTIEKSRRPLEKLDLAGTLSVINSEDRANCWGVMARVLFDRRPEIAESEIDLSGTVMYEGDVESFHEELACMVASHSDHIREALLRDLPVKCRLRGLATGYINANGTGQISLYPDPDAVYTIVEVGDDDWYHIAMNRHDNTEIEYCWVRSHDVRELSVGDRTLVGMQFTSLILDDSGTSQTFNLTIPPWLRTVGPSLKKLSLCRATAIHASLPEILLSCLNLTHLNLEGCRLNDAQLLWQQFHDGSVPRLQSLDVSGNLLGATGVEQLLVLIRSAPTLPLRHLALRQNHIGHAGLIHLAELMRESTKLEVFEFDAKIEGDAGHAYASQRQLLTDRHDNELLSETPLSLPSRLAFLSALQLLATRQVALRALDTPMLSLIFEFAADAVMRHLLWW